MAGETPAVGFEQFVDIATPSLQRLQWDSGQQCIRTKRSRTSSVDFFRQCHDIDLRTTTSTENREDDPLGRATFGSCAGGSSAHSSSMRFPSTNCLGKADESTAFVTLAWDELFHFETPDSYRPRLFDTRLLVTELAELAALAQDDSRWTRHVRLVQNEISESTRLESRWVANTAWTTALVTTIVNASDLREIEDLTGLFLATSSPAISNLMEALRRESRNLPRNKRQILEILKLLATNARILGFVNIQDNFTVGEELYSENCFTVVDHICTSLEIQKRDFNCIVRMRGDKSTIQSAIRNTKVRISGKRDFPLDENGRSFKDGINNGEVPVSIQTKATSHFNAAVHALKECRRVVDIANLYNNRSSIAISNTVLAEDELHTEIVDRHTEKHLDLKPHRDARRLTAEALASIQFDNLDESLDNALEHHSLALASSDPKTSLVNLWTAFECLVGGTSTGRSSLDRMTSLFSPIVTMRRTEKITRYLAACTHRFHRALSLTPNGLFGRSSKFFFSARDVFEALSQGENNELILRLFKDVGIHPLLRYRFYSAWKGMHEPKIIASDLVKSHQRLAWHIARIYRARNLTIHLGKDSEGVSDLVGNLQYYFSRCISIILSDLKRNKEWSVAMSLQHNRQMFSFVVDSLKSNPSVVSGEYLFPHDEHFREYFPWR